jgi:hypothetical protein
MTTGTVGTTATEVLFSKSGTNGSVGTTAAEVLFTKSANNGFIGTTAAEVLFTKLATNGSIGTAAVEVMFRPGTITYSYSDVYRTKQGVFGATGNRMDIHADTRA